MGWTQLGLWKKSGTEVGSGRVVHNRDPLSGSPSWPHLAPKMDQAGLQMVPGWHHLGHAGPKINDNNDDAKNNNLNNISISLHCIASAFHRAAFHNDDDDEDNVDCT